MDEFPNEKTNQLISSSFFDLMIDNEIIKLQIWKFPSEEVNLCIYNMIFIFFLRNGIKFMKNTLKNAKVILYFGLLFEFISIRCFISF